MNDVLIFGGAGFIGTNLALSALERGHSVAIFDNLCRTGADRNLEMLTHKGGDRVAFCKADIRSAEKTRDFFSKHRDARAVFHLAGQVAVTASVRNPREDFEINALGTLNLLEAMREFAIPAPFVYASTNKVYGGMIDVAIVEKDRRYEYGDYPNGIPETFALDFHSPYGCSKGSADQYVLDYSRIYGLKTVVFRQSCIYGYHQYGIEDQGWVAWFTIAGLFGSPITIYGNGKQVRDVLFVDDLAAAYWLAVEKIDRVSGKVFNIGGGHFQMSLLELLAHLERIIGKPIALRFAGPRPGDQPVFVSDVSKAQRELGWVPQTSVEEGLEKLAGWALENRARFVEAGLIR